MCRPSIPNKNIYKSPRGVTIPLHLDGIKAFIIIIAGFVVFGCLYSDVTPIYGPHSLAKSPMASQLLKSLVNFLQGVWGREDDDLRFDSLKSAFMSLSGSMYTLRTGIRVCQPGVLSLVCLKDNETLRIFRWCIKTLPHKSCFFYSTLSI